MALQFHQSTSTLVKKKCTLQIQVKIVDLLKSKPTPLPSLLSFSLQVSLLVPQQIDSTGSLEKATINRIFLILPFRKEEHEILSPFLRDQEIGSSHKNA